MLFRQKPLEQESKPENTRRRFLKFVGEVTAGASVAVIGVIASAGEAFGCVPCRGCTIQAECTGNPNCFGRTGYYSAWTTLSGCVGHCVTIHNSGCYNIVDCKNVVCT